MYTTTYTFTNPNFDILSFYLLINDPISHFNTTYSQINTNTFIFTSDTQQNLDNFISYLNGDTSNY
jgi:hypothetical protein